MSRVDAKRWLHTFVVINQVSIRGLLARKASWFGILVFAACLLVLFPFAMGAELVKQTEVRYGAFWAAQEFIVALAMSRVFSAEQEAGALEFLLASRSPRSAILFGKMSASVLQLLSLQLPALLLWFLLYNFFPATIWPTTQKVIPLLFFFDLGTAALGALLACVTARSLAKEILFPILFFPLQLALLLAAVSLCLRGESSLVLESVSASSWWAFLVLYPIIFVAVGMMLGDNLLEE